MNASSRRRLRQADPGLSQLRAVAPHALFHNQGTNATAGAGVREHGKCWTLHRRAGGELSDILFKHLRNKVAAAIDHMEEVGAAGEDALVEPF